MPTVIVPRRPQMTERESENAQAAREIASLDPTSDPEPGALYGLTPDPDTDSTYA